MDQLDAMRVFLSLADAGSFSGAARERGVPVASVSRKLQALEAHLGAKLVSRSTRRMALTDAGRRYLGSCREIVGAVEEADRSMVRANGALDGTLRVTAPVAFGRLHVLPVVTAFLDAHPRVDVRLVLSDDVVELIDAGVDVAVRIAALPDSSLVATRVGDVRLVCCASPDYLARRGAPERPEDLARHDCITVTPHASPERWSFPVRGTRRSFSVRSRLVVTTAEAAVDAAVAGAGIARVLSYQVAAGLADGRLVAVLPRFEPPSVPVSVVHAEGRAPSARVRGFAKLAAERLRAALRVGSG